VDKKTIDDVEVAQTGTGYSLETGPVIIAAGVKTTYVGGGMTF
jgi:hypothetical protein